VRTSKGDIRPFSCTQVKHCKTSPDLLETSNKVVTGACSENVQNLKKTHITELIAPRDPRANVLIYERERINLVFLLNYRIFNLSITPFIL
jgi:hypothetical protein